MAFRITPTTELQAVNTLLSIIGEAPVSSITGNTGVDVSIALQILDEKISIFKARQSVPMSGAMGTLPNNLYRLGTISNAGNNIEIEQVPRSLEGSTNSLSQTYLTAPSASYPRNYSYIRRSFLQVEIFPPLSSVVCNFIRKPKTPQWTYVVVNEKALYNPNNQTTNFEIHDSDEVELVYKILSLAGIVINKPGLGSYAEQQITAQKTQEKQ